MATPSGASRKPMTAPERKAALQRLGVQASISTRPGTARTSHTVRMNAARQVTKHGSELPDMSTIRKVRLSQRSEPLH